MQGMGIFDQLPGLAAYTQILLGFPLAQQEQNGAEDASRKVVVSALERAALTLTKTFPFLAGQVVHVPEKGHEDSSSGFFRIVEYEADDGNPTLRVRDCTEVCPTYDEIAEAKAPMSMLDGSILAPMKGLPDHYDNSTVQPVMIIQANFVMGGLLLCFACQHNAIDMNGQGQVIRLFATLCRGEEFSEAQVREGNVDRTKLVRLLDADQVPLAHEKWRRPSQLSSPGWASSPAPAPWRLYNFTRAKLVKLKEEAAKECGPGKEVGWLSTDDALSSFLWQRVSLARSSRFGGDAQSTLIRAVNARRRVVPPISEGYMGHLVACTWTAMPLEQAAHGPLSTTALQIRKSLLDIDDYHVRSLLTTIKSTRDKTTIAYEAHMDPDTDIIMSSWAELRLYQCSFGPLLGKPGFVRRPSLTDCQSMAYLMPRTDEGDIAVAMSLMDVDGKALLSDSVWTATAELIG